MKKRRSFLLRFFLLILLALAPAIAYKLYVPSAKYSTGEPVSRQAIQNYFSNDRIVSLTPDFMRYLVMETGIKNRRTLPAKTYRQILDEAGIITKFSARVNFRNALLVPGVPLAIAAGMFLLFVLPWRFRAAKKQKEAMRERVRIEQEVEVQKRKNAEMEGARKHEEERRKLQDQERSIAIQKHRDRANIEKSEIESFEIYFSGLQSAAGASAGLPAFIKVLENYREKDLMPATKQAVDAKIAELVNEHKRQQIIRQAQADIAGQTANAAAGPAPGNKPEEFNY